MKRKSLIIKNVFKICGVDKCKSLTFNNKMWICVFVKDKGLLFTVNDWQNSILIYHKANLYAK